MNDTPQQVEQLYQKKIMSRTPAERLKMAANMYTCARKLLAAGWMHEGEQRSSEVWRKHLFLRLYGNDFTASEMTRILSRMFPAS